MNSDGKHRTVRRITASEHTVAVAGVSVVSLVSFGLQAPRLGFYWDDFWHHVVPWVTFGPSGVREAVIGQRPFYHFHLIPLLAALDVSPLRWHLMMLAVLVAQSIVVVEVLRLGLDTESSLAAALLFAVSPSLVYASCISTQFMSSAWVNFFFLLSLLLSAKSVLLKGRLVALLCLVSSAICAMVAFTYGEYAYSSELVRFPFLSLAIARAEGPGYSWCRPWLFPTPRFRRLLTASALNGAVLFAFAMHRIFFFSASTREFQVSESLSWLASPLKGALMFLRSCSFDTIYALSLSWMELFWAPFEGVAYSWIIWSSLVGVFVGAVVLFLLRRSQAPGSEATREGAIPWLSAAAGLVWLAASMLVIWAAGRSAVLTYGPRLSSYLLMPGAVGVSVLLASGLRWLLEDRGRRNMVLACVVGSAVVGHQIYQLRFADLWRDTAAFAEQMGARFPAMGEGAVVLVDWSVFDERILHFDDLTPLVAGLYPGVAQGRLLVLPLGAGHDDCLRVLNGGGREVISIHGDREFVVNGSRCLVYFDSSERVLVTSIGPRGFLPSGASISAHAAARCLGDVQRCGVGEPGRQSAFDGELLRRMGVKVQGNGMGWAAVLQKIQKSAEARDWRGVVSVWEAAGGRVNCLSRRRAPECVPVVEALRALGREKEASSLASYLTEQDWWTGEELGTR